MPPSKGFFDKIPCPVRGCHAPNCMFAHEDDAKAEVQHATAPSEPLVKRRRLGGELTKHDLDAAFAQVPEVQSNGASDTIVNTQKITEPTSPTPHLSDDTSDGVSSEDESSAEQPVSSTEQMADKRVSPPPLRRVNVEAPATEIGPHKVTAAGVKEVLNPRLLTHPPAGHPTRVLYLKKLHEAMKVLNDNLRINTKHGGASVALTDDQLTIKALDEEAKIATDNPSVYPNVLKQTLQSYKKMTPEQWQAAIVPLVGNSKSHTPADSRRPAVKGERALDTGLTESQDRQILARLLAKQHGLEEFGYVTLPPSKAEVDEARAGVEMSGGFEKCERCQSRFQVFSTRSEDGNLTTGGPCLYHHGRAVKADRGSERAYTCCNEPLGASLGCTKCDSHVFRVYDPKRLAALVPFECTPDNPNLDDDRAVTFDCEMGFTSNGMELLRVSALSWPTGDVLLDVLVQPLGQVFDLNTRYSGVSSEQLSKARGYNHSKKPDAQSGLRVVKSVIHARKLLFSLLTPSTPLIGHAIENDLNATRIVHPCIIDTVLLCPHPAGGLPYRRSLKVLAQDYLWRTIQTAGAQGHDSMEDSRATGDIVREMVRRAWFKMKRNGWQVQDDKLISPSPGSKGSTGLAPPQSKVKAYLRTEAEKWADAQRTKADESRKMGCHGEKRTYEDMDDLMTVEMDY